MGSLSRPADVRSHSVLGISPENPDHLVEIYQTVSRVWARASLQGYASFDGGRQWRPAAAFPLPEGATGLADPVVVWDGEAQPVMAAVALRRGRHVEHFAAAVYRSDDGGLHWSAPHVLECNPRVHQPAAASDTNTASPHYGRVYVAWCAGGELRLAAGDGSADGWIRTEIDENCFCPEILVAPDGGVLLAWMEGQAGSRIFAAHSSDGGRRFTAPAPVASGITSLRGSLPESEGWPHFPGANFRVLTVPAGIVTPGGGTVFAWADFRGGISRIHYRYRPSAIAPWEGPPEGRPLLDGVQALGQQEFLPRLLLTPMGEVCCAFYEYGPKADREDGLVDLVLAVSGDRGRTFSQRMVVTQEAWNPARDAPAGSTRGGLAWMKLTP